MLSCITSIEGRDVGPLDAGAGGGGMGGVCWDSRRDFLCGGGGGGVATERGYSSNVESSRGVVLPVGTACENRKLSVYSSILLQTLVYLSTILYTQYTPVN